MSCLVTSDRQLQIVIPDFKLRNMIDVGSDKIKMWNPVWQMRKYVSGRQSAGMKWSPESFSRPINHARSFVLHLGLRIRRNNYETS